MMGRSLWLWPNIKSDVRQKTRYVDTMLVSYQSNENIALTCLLVEMFGCFYAVAYPEGEREKLIIKGDRWAGWQGWRGGAGVHAA